MCAKCFRKDWVYLVGVLDFPGTGLGSLGNWKSVRGQLVEKKPTLHLEQKCMVCKPAPFFGTKICHHHIYSKRCCGHHMLAMLGLSYTAVHCLSSIHCLHIVTERFHIFQFQLNLYSRSQLKPRLLKGVRSYRFSVESFFVLLTWDKIIYDCSYF